MIQQSDERRRIFEDEEYNMMAESNPFHEVILSKIGSKYEFR